jgi:hypothetical protein
MAVILAFHHCAKIPEAINLKGGKIYFSSWFQMLQSMVSRLHCFGPQMRQKVLTAKEAAHLMADRSKKEQEEEQK